MSAECWVCGDGVDKCSGEWDHCEDLGIEIDGTLAVTHCKWGKPYAPGGGVVIGVAPNQTSQEEQK